MQRHEVDVRAFGVCVRAGACRVEETGPEAGIGRTDRFNLPVAGISWTAAEAYCTWLGGRLPTEEEWQRAAQAGDGRLWPWGTSARCPVYGADAQVDVKFSEAMEHCEPVVARLSRTLNDDAMSAIGDRLAEWTADGVRAYCSSLMDVGDDVLVAEARRRLEASHAEQVAAGASDADCVVTELQPPGTLRPGHPQGFTGLAANVGEWVADPWRVGDVVDAGRRVVRGGSYLTEPDTWTTTARASLPLQLKAPDVGVRCAWDAP